MPLRQNSRYTLHITISSLFIVLIIVFGSVLTWQNYRKTSAIILASGDQVFDQINRELLLDFGSIRKSVNQAIHFLSAAPIIQAATLEQRLQSLPLLRQTLINEPNMSAMQFGYPNGDFFIIRPMTSELLRKHFAAPTDTQWVVDNISVDALANKQLTRLFYDSKLQELSRTILPTQYDPRIRPWYTLAIASEEAVGTRPYLFYFMKKVGMTLALKSTQQEVIVAADVTLDQLSGNLEPYRITPSTEIVVFEDNGNALIYRDTQRLIRKTETGDFKIAKLSQLGSEVLAFIGDDFKVESQSLSFSFNEQQWLGSTRKLQIPGGGTFFVLMVSPEHELLAEANLLRKQSLLITLAIIAIFIPVIWLFAKGIAKPIRRLATEARVISGFDFTSPIETTSIIQEVDELAEAMSLMKQTISQFLSLIHSLAEERNFDALLHRVTLETMNICQADGALTYLFNDEDKSLQPGVLQVGEQSVIDLNHLPTLAMDDHHALVKALNSEGSSLITLQTKNHDPLNVLLTELDASVIKLVALPLRNRQDEIIGVLNLMYRNQASHQRENQRIKFVQALSGFAAVTLESKQMLKMQKLLLQSFIKLIAGAIDSKSPYTGGHCQRVPELTKMLARAACDSEQGIFHDYHLNEEQWEELHIAGWLHDCGKVTTPEYVVDKATKLETIYDRIHEVRMRFEVLKRDAEIAYWQQIVAGGDADQLAEKLTQQQQQLDDDFAFIAECNVGGEFLAQDKVARLKSLAETTWMRTLDDRLGISWEELQRKQLAAEQVLPATEKLLADKVDHLIVRHANDRMPEDNPWGFKVDVPEYKYNRGELYNLVVLHGTLSEEERFKINDHIVQTIIMLDGLPFPKHLSNVSLIAGSHHEKMDGSGYPKRLTAEQMPISARIMAIADIFEALTASDRPYKQAKTLSEAIKIMSFMVKDKHIDPDLFSLFLKSGVYLDYAERFMQPEQVDEVAISSYL